METCEGEEALSLNRSRQCNYKVRDLRRIYPHRDPLQPEPATTREPNHHSSTDHGFSPCKRSQSFSNLSCDGVSSR